MTIKEIANIVGVSRGTVDRVINKRGGVNPETEKRIRQIIDALDFVPNIAGRSLAVKRKNLKFGVILRLDNPRYDILDTIKRKASDFLAYGIKTIILEADINDDTSYLRILDQFMLYGVCGIIVMLPDNPAIIEKLCVLEAKGIAVVSLGSLNKNFRGLASVCIDNYQCGRIIGHLLGLLTGDHGHIAITTFPEPRPSAAARKEGLINKLSESFPNIQIVDTVYNSDNDIVCYTELTALLANHPEINSLYIDSAGVFGACRAVEECKRPIRVLCYDSTELAHTRKYLKNGIITILVEQLPQVQASLAMDVLFNFCVCGTLPSTHDIYTKIDIKVRDSLLD